MLYTISTANTLFFDLPLAGNAALLLSNLASGPSPDSVTAHTFGLILWIGGAFLSCGALGFWFNMGWVVKEAKRESGEALTQSSRAIESVAELDRKVTTDMATLRDDLGIMEQNVQREIHKASMDQAEMIRTHDIANQQRIQSIERQLIENNAGVNSVLRSLAALEKLPVLAQNAEVLKAHLDEIRRVIRDTVVPRPEVEQYFKLMEHRQSKVENFLMGGAFVDRRSLSATGVPPVQIGDGEEDAI